MLGKLYQLPHFQLCVVPEIYCMLNREPTPQARKVAGLSRPGVSKVKKKKTLVAVGIRTHDC